MGLFDIFGGNDTGGLNRGYKLAAKELKRGREALQQGKQEAYGFYDEAKPYWEDLSGYGKTGATAYSNALGLGGQEGVDSARNMFQTSPGYQFQMDEGLKAINRLANSRGMLSSGNNTQDLLRFSQGLANQDYWNWLNQLSGFPGIQQNAASGLSNVAAGKSNAALGTGSNLANLSGTGANLAYQNALNQYAANQAGSANMWNAILGLGSGLVGLI